MEPFVALITPVTTDSKPDQPPGIWGGANEPFPTPPIVIVPPDEPSEPPLVIWGGGNEPFPTHPIVIVPTDPPLAIWGGANEPFPEHPMAPGGEPPGIWGGANEGFPTNPIVLPIPPDPFPEPPPDEGRIDGIVLKRPPEDGGWGYLKPGPGWFYVPGPGEPSPK